MKIFEESNFGFCNFWRGCFSLSDSKVQVHSQKLWIQIIAYCLFVNHLIPAWCDRRCDQHNLQMGGLAHVIYHVIHHMTHRMTHHVTHHMIYLGKRTGGLQLCTTARSTVMFNFRWFHMSWASFSLPYSIRRLMNQSWWREEENTSFSRSGLRRKSMMRRQKGLYRIYRVALMKQPRWSLRHTQYDTRHEKTHLKIFVVVIPKEGWRAGAPTMLLWVWRGL